MSAKILKYDVVYEKNTKQTHLASVVIAQKVNDLKTPIDLNDLFCPGCQQAKLKIVSSKNGGYIRGNSKQQHGKNCSYAVKKSGRKTKKLIVYQQHLTAKLKIMYWYCLTA